MSPKCIAATGAPRTRYGEAPLYEEGLYDLGGDCYGWLVPNGSWGEANAGLVVGDGASLLIDTLWDVRTTRVMLDTMAPLIAKTPLETVVNTHSDGDHFYGNQLVAEAEIWTSAAARRAMDHHKPRSMLAFARLGGLLISLPWTHAQEVGQWFQSMCAPYAFHEVRYTPATHTFEGTQTLAVGGREVRLIEVGPAHTAGDLIVHVPDARLLYASDILFIGSTPVMWAGPVGNWLKALDLILSLDVDLIVPGHGPLTDKEGVKLVQAFWQHVAAETRRRYEAGMRAEDAAADIVTSPAYRAQPFAHWDSPERMMTNVHVLYTEFAGRALDLKPLQILNIMRKQAILAHTLPDATPAAMHQTDAVLT